MERNDLQVKGHSSGRESRNGDVKQRPLVAVVLGQRPGAVLSRKPSGGVTVAAAGKASGMQWATACRYGDGQRGEVVTLTLVYGLSRCRTSRLQRITKEMTLRISSLSQCILETTTRSATRQIQRVATIQLFVRNGRLFMSIYRGQSIFMTSEGIDYSADPLREPPDYRTIPVIESKWLCRVSAPPTAH